MNKKLTPYILITPVVISLLILLLGPLLAGIGMSFQQTTFSGETQFVGFQNYLNLFNEGTRFGHDLFVTIVYVSFVIVLTIPFAYLTALLITRNSNLSRIFRSIYLFPWISAPVVSTLMVKTMLNPEFGIIHFVVRYLAGHDVYILNNGNYALVVMILHSFWRSSPFIMLFLAAGISTLPKEYYEAAKVDGASKIRSFFSITVPLTANQLGMGTLMVTIWTLQDSESVFALTNGGPGNATETLALRLFKSSFVNFNLNMGATLGVFLVAISLLFLTLYLRLMFKGSDYA